MSVNYSVCMLPNPARPDEPKKAYAKAQATRVLDVKSLSNRISHGCSLTRSDVCYYRGCRRDGGVAQRR